ncbi:unnamed protein product [Blepharisma stoltei]|uniref:C2H2-type domain-containing protein n=1 Tax=Blepharisma stoltei TaxID=1481888 RepID=A0AAU9IKI9_9CILI|nr:unnamed protein product [Blepharisma stoltei]
MDLQNSISLSTQICSNHFTTHIQNDNRILFKCATCSKTFFSLSEMRDHIIVEFDLDKELIGFLNFEMGIDQYSDDSDIQTSSPECEDNSSFEPIECYKCLKICKGTKGLNQHLGKRHSDGKNKEICEVCGKSFKHKYAVNFHINQVHAKATRVKCQVCGKQLYNKYVLSQHLKKQHSIQSLS